MVGNKITDIKSFFNVSIADEVCAVNSIYEILGREGITIALSGVPIVKGIGSHNINIFQIVGAVEVLNQYAIITEVTDLTNLTDMYADVWDGTASEVLTAATGADLTGAPVGSFFTKAEIKTQPYNVLLADQGRMLETGNRDAGRPFIVNSKNAVDTFIRFNFDTSSGVDFKMDLFFKYRIPDGGSISLV